MSPEGCIGCVQGTTSAACAYLGPYGVKITCTHGTRSPAGSIGCKQGIRLCACTVVIVPMQSIRAKHTAAATNFNISASKLLVLDILLLLLIHARHGADFTERPL